METKWDLIARSEADPWPQATIPLTHPPCGTPETHQRGRQDKMCVFHSANMEETQGSTKKVVSCYEVHFVSAHLNISFTKHEQNFSLQKHL